MVDSDSDEAPPSSRAQFNEELGMYVKTNVIRAAVGIVLLSALLAATGMLFEPELLRLAESVYLALGVLGLSLALLLTDSVFSPVPPDMLLLVVAKSSLHQHWPIVLPAAGFISAAAGNLGWLLGGLFGRIPFTRGYVARLRARYERPIRRFDRWAIALGALTPLPFSLTCVTAGALGMPWKRFAPVTLLRVPRFIVFYWLIFYSTAV